MVQGRGDAKERSGEGASERNWPYQLVHVFVPSFICSFVHSFIQQTSVEYLPCARQL